MDRLITFQDAISETAEVTRHLLLGNGFSIACFPNIFTYGSLFDQANFDTNPRLKKLFEALEVNDFEHVIRVVEGASRVMQCYISNGPQIAGTMVSDAKELKDILIQTLVRHHPNNPGVVSDEKFGHCRRFLSYFVGPDNDKGRIYTLNYDLLLYWAVMHSEPDGCAQFELAKNDGFGRDEDTEEDYVDWMGEGSARDQRIHYLHGALHLFDAGHELSKYTWINTGVTIIEQVRDAMNLGKFPLFVSEGESNKKLARIKHSAYLYHSYKSFSTNLGFKRNALFVFGHSLDDNDMHILKKISKGKISRMYVSLHGEFDSSNNKIIRSKANSLASGRSASNPLEIVFYDAKSAYVWGQ